MRNARLLRALALGSFLLVPVLAGCVDEQKVYGDQPPFGTDPSPAALGFLGYSPNTEGIPICGNCHSVPLAEWKGTVHAEAWADLQASGHASSTCENCHTVNQLGNATTQPGGWAATGDPRFHDVQCESCHGPGQQHIAAPGAVQPLASLAVGLDLTNGCGECHNGTHHPFVEEWSASPHSVVVSAASGRAECRGCHVGQGILAAWGVNGPYLEKDSPDPLGIVCGVCHDPHDATNEGQLRFPVNTTSIETHLCARCHNRRTVPDPNSSHGLEPHAPEAELLTGDAGWIPPGAEIDAAQFQLAHGPSGNPKLCATCHVVSYEITDETTGAFLLNTTGHLFRPIPCVDEQGIPTAATDCPLTAEARSFKGCVASGCHAEESGVASLFALRSGQLQAQADALLELLKQVDPNLDEPGGEIDPTNPTFTVAEGAFFDYNLAVHGGDALPATAHNPFLVRALLTGSAEAVITEYGLAASRIAGAR